MQKVITNCVIKDGVVLKNGKTVFGNELMGTGAGSGRQGARGAKAGMSEKAAMGEFLLALYQHLGLNYPRFYKMDALSKLGWLATEVLLMDDFAAEDYRPEQVGVILANAHSSLDTDLKYFETVKEIASPSLFVYTLPSIMIGEIGIRNNFKGESAFFVSGRYDADFMEQYVRGLMDENRVSACIYGWVDLLGEAGEAKLFLIK